MNFIYYFNRKQREKESIILFYNKLIKYMTMIFNYFLLQIIILY